MSFEDDERDALLRKLNDELRALEAAVAQYWRDRARLSVHGADAIVMVMAEQIARLIHMMGSMLASEKQKPRSRLPRRR
ncbi:MAG: hypothetical protein J2P54_05410 [Bradyrhizobiaceae bacterium]|nr:hypothetical protein [Bradyrhizobiaceae bacterium]